MLVVVFEWNGGGGGQVQTPVTVIGHAVLLLHMAVCHLLPQLLQFGWNHALSKGVQRQSLVGLDGQQALSLQTQEMLLLELLDLEQLLLKRQLLCGHLFTLLFAAMLLLDELKVELFLLFLVELLELLLL